MKQLFGVYDLISNKYDDFSEGVLHLENGSCCLWVMGRAETENEINNLEKIAQIYEADGVNLTEKVFGVFVIIAFDKTAKKLNVFHDRSTSCLATYYVVKDDKIYVGTSLKKILAESKITRKMNEKSVEDFYVNGFIYGEDTLLENVKKIKAFHCLSVENGHALQLKVNYPVKKMTKGEALDNFKPTVDRAIEKCFEGEDEINLPLSSGYDSNYNAYIASEKTDLPINAFSIGGKRGKNELPVVESNIKYYKRMQLKSALTDENTLKNFPDIVWRLEGAVYEVGLPLQYELAQLVSKNGKKTLVCGEVADQVMNLYYLQGDRLEPDKKDGETIHYEFSEYPFIFGNFLILKKNGILANSFGIETRYPYLDNDLVSVCNALKSENQKDKRIHVANCNECLPQGVLDNMKKIGGSTDCHSLFENENEIRKLINLIKECNFYKSHLEMIEKFSYTEKNELVGFNKIKNNIRTFIFDLFNINKTSRDNSKYFNEEMELRECLSIAYLAIFEKLFVEKDVDFNKTEINESLYELINIK